MGATPAGREQLSKLYGGRIRDADAVTRKGNLFLLAVGLTVFSYLITVCFLNFIKNFYNFISKFSLTFFKFSSVFFHINFLSKMLYLKIFFFWKFLQNFSEFFGTFHYLLKTAFSTLWNDCSSAYYIPATKIQKNQKHQYFSNIKTINTFQVSEVSILIKYQKYNYSSSVNTLHVSKLSTKSVKIWKIYWNLKNWRF